MTDPLDPAARRLVVASALRLHVARALGTGPLGSDPADLTAAAAALRPIDDTLARVHGLSFSPGYPGTDAAPATALRLVLTCRAAHRGEPAAVVVTTLIPGRAPQVTAAPPGARPASPPA